MFARCIIVLMSILALAGCSEPPPPPAAWSAGEDLGLAWVQQAAEYQALSLQAYHQAERALPAFIADKSWTAQPGQTHAKYLPPAVIFDVDETIVSGVDFQIAVERPVTQAKLNRWNGEHRAQAVPGFTRFALAARAAGVELFFLTNRPCEAIEGVDDPCPYKKTILDDIHEAGIEVDADHVWLANEHDNWTKEKLGRRETLSRSHRIIMLFGDDISDFIPCVRATPAAPCTEPATADSRRRKVDQFAGYWGNGWYILPNPMHGSWKSFPKP